MKQYRFAPLFTLMCLIFSIPALAQDHEFQEGGQYERLNEAQPVQTGDRIEVVEMFWYRCPHCYRLEPYLEKWSSSKPENAELVPIPAILSDSWEFHAKVYYTFEALGFMEALHTKFFDAIHRNRVRFTSPEQVQAWVGEQGFDNRKFVDTFHSFAVTNKTNSSRLKTRDYGISGVPAVIVDGKYLTNVAMAGGHEELLKVINFLVDKAATERNL